MAKDKLPLCHLQEPQHRLSAALTHGEAGTRNQDDLRVRSNCVAPWGSPDEGGLAGRSVLGSADSSGPGEESSRAAAQSGRLKPSPHAT